jgi:hypothetical protein
VTAILGITIFNTILYFAGRTSAVNLSLIAISIFIVALRIAFKEKISAVKQ